jgi:hypothetical protein
MLPQSYRSDADLQHAVFGQRHVPMGQTMTEDTPDFTQLDDSALISRRAQMRAELERLPPHSAGHDALSRAYDASTGEINARARAAWTPAS